jgi:hypothetical protein
MIPRKKHATITLTPKERAEILEIKKAIEARATSFGDKARTNDNTMPKKIDLTPIDIRFI